MLAQLINNWSNDEIVGNNHDEENTNTEPPKTEKSKGSSAIDANVIKGIQTQIISLIQRDELKNVGMTRPYLLEWDLVPYPSNLKPLTLHISDGKGSPNQHIYYFQSQTRNMIDNDTVMATLFIDILKGVAFD